MIVDDVVELLLEDCPGAGCSVVVTDRRIISIRQCEAAQERKSKHKK
jgi:hypothetical protein